MKKLFPIIAIVLLLFSVLSCDSGLKRVEDGNVNYYIYPYLKFTLSSDRTYFIASVVEGAKLTTVSVPGFVHTDFGAMPVKEFAGFEDINDSINLEEVILDVHIEKVSDGAFDKAENLMVVKTSGDKEGPKWAHLPTLTREGYHFIGWKAGDTYVFNGMPIDPENTEAVPVWAELIHHDAKEANCITVGNIEYWECSECGKLFSDSYARNEVSIVTLPTEGHLYPLKWVLPKEATCIEEGITGHYKCERCHKTFLDAEGKEEITDVVIPALDHSYGEWYTYVEATCTEDGEERRECSRCDWYESRIVPATGHTPDENIYGINDPEQHWYHCSVDNVDYGFENHTYGDWRETEEPGMSRERECTLCHHMDYTALPHIWRYVEPVEPDCTQSGNYGYWWCELHEGEYTFDEDHEVLVSWSDIYRPVAGHRMEYHPYAAATCRNDGNSEYWYCTVCHKYFSDVLGRNEIVLPDTVISHHTVDHFEAVAPTCTEEGSIEYWYCRDEGRYFKNEACTDEIASSETIAEPLGHTFSMPPLTSEYSHDDYNHWLPCSRCEKEFHIYESGLVEGREAHIWG